MNKDMYDLMQALSVPSFCSRTHSTRGRKGLCKHSFETKEKMSNSSPRRKKVITPLGSFESLIQATLAHGFARPAILRGKIRKGAEGYYYG